MSAGKLPNCSFRDLLRDSWVCIRLTLHCLPDCSRVRRPLPSFPLENAALARPSLLDELQCEIRPGKTNAYNITIPPTIAASTMLCLKTALKIAASLPSCCVAALATTIDCASIILPITPPAELAAHISTGLRFSCSAVTFCRLPNSPFHPASVPVTAPPLHHIAKAH